MVLDIERYINGKSLKIIPSDRLGCKVIGLRNKHDYELLVNIPILASFVNSLDEYTSVIADVKNILHFI